MTKARRGLKVRVKVMGRANAVGPTSIESSFFQLAFETCAVQSVESVLKDYEHDLETYAKVGDILNEEMTKGLSKDGNKDSTVKMLITYVRNLPTGKGTR